MLINPATSTADITVNIIGGGDTPSIMLAAGYSGTFSLVISPVALTVTAKDAVSGAVVVGGRVLVTAYTGGALPYQASVGITRVAAVATVAHTAHAMTDGKKVLIKGAVQPEYNGVHVITVTGVDAYTYTVSDTPATPATGSPVATAVIIDADTNSSGIATDTRSYSVAQPVIGRVRKGTTSPRYKTSPLSGEVSTTGGLSVTVQMVPDE